MKNTVEINGITFNTDTAKVWFDELYKGCIAFVDGMGATLTVIMEKDKINIYVNDQLSNVGEKVVSSGTEAREILGERISKMIDDRIKK